MPAIDAATAAELVETIRGFVRRDVLPVASDLDHADTYPDRLVDQLAEFGLFGSLIPESHGGLGLDVTTYARIVEELAAGWMSLTGVLNTHMIAALLIGLHGSDEQRDRLLPEMASGRARGALSLSEADAGSDVRAIRCQATRDGDEYVINGTKMWVTNGLRSRVVALAARTAEGVTCFIVEKEPGLRSGGIEVSRHIDKLGYRGVETVEMTYVDHRVPADAVLGGAQAIWARAYPRSSVRSNWVGSTWRRGGLGSPGRLSKPPSRMRSNGRPSAFRSPGTRRLPSSWPTWGCE